MAPRVSFLNSKEATFLLKFLLLMAVRAKKGVYLLDARAVIGRAADKDGRTAYTLHLYATDVRIYIHHCSRIVLLIFQDMQTVLCLVLIIAGKVSKGTFQLQQERASDMDVAQYAGSSSQNLRVRCYFPDGSQFAKTPDHHTPPTIL